MGHHSFHLIDNNCENFEAKIKNAKSAVMDTLGLQAGQYFANKYLLKHSTTKNLSRMPIHLPINTKFEQSERILTWLKVPDTQNENKRITQSMLIRAGNNKAFTYTHIMTYDNKGKISEKKK